MTSPTLADLNPATLAKAPPRFHLLAKPSDSTCNLFFTHTRPAMTIMARLVQQGKYADGVMDAVAADDTKRGRNDPCACGNRKKFKACHGSRQS